MATGLESAGLKMILDLMLGGWKRAREVRLKSNARDGLTRALKELLNLSPDLPSVERDLALARAAGILEREVFVVEDLLRKHKASVKRPAKKAARKPAKKAAKKLAKKAARKPAKKASK